MTVADRVIAHVRARGAPIEGQAPPCAILWTDPRGEWRRLVASLQPRAEELLVLGEFDQARRTGPAIWLRCIVDRTLPGLPDDAVPIVYLPGVGRQDLRAGEGCEPSLQPLVEMMYRGALWLQHNGSDWGVRTFLTSGRALGLDIAGDNATFEALLRALPEIAVTPVRQLQGRHLAADDFDRMLSTDVVRDLLQWMGDPEGTLQRLGDDRWGAFRNQCQDTLDFDPETDADVTAGERLGAGTGKWAEVWDRFQQSPTAFPHIVDLLRRSRPSGTIPLDRERWPEVNDQCEADVRQKFVQICGMPIPDARKAIGELEVVHGRRRQWVWARLGQSPMAQVLEPLGRLAEATEKVIGGATPDAAATVYAERGWVADAAAWEALSKAPASDEEMVGRVVRHVLLPWLDESARAFQQAVAKHPLPAAGCQPLVRAHDEGCVLFTDGLRYDLGQRLCDRLESRGCRTALSRRWSATPTVTATAKPAVTPVADEIAGDKLGDDFYPTHKPTGKLSGAQLLRDAMKSQGYQILDGGTFDFPDSHPAHGWSETGTIDELGHKLEIRMANQIDDELDRLADRVLKLLDAGWKSVRIVTDHGWLLLPGGLPKVDLPKHLTLSRWARCAVVAGNASPDITRSPWHWNPAETFATAPGVHCFNKTPEYAHGGLSLQECLIPDILVERGDDDAASATITSITWRGMRCWAEGRATGTGIRGDLKLQTPTGKSVAATPKALDEDGSVNLVLKCDEHENDQLVLVLFGPDGNILAHKLTRVGEDS